MPSRRVAVRIPIVRFLPSGRSLLLGFALLGLALGGYVLARQTSMFAVRQVEVTGARASVVARVDRALAPLAGQSLLSLDGATIDRRLQALPDVSLVSYDRAFPHTARIVVSAERPVAVLRHGTEAWLVTERGRVLRRLDDPTEWSLPRIWVADSAVPSDGSLLTDGTSLAPALVLGRVLAADKRVFARVGEARAVDGELALVLRGGPEVRLGAGDDIPLQLAVAKRVLDLAQGEVQYVDVSVPQRAVVG
ncbi:MAG: FtsQ-type POTRA domain-containing protein [Actinomycetota bacterium]